MTAYAFSPIADVQPYVRRYASVSHSVAAANRGMVALGGDDHAVAYVDTGDAWVTAGPPLCAPERAADVALGFTERAADAGRRVVFFGVDDALGDATGLQTVAIGQEAVCDPTRWQTTARRPTVREQLRRARAKGVRISVARTNGLTPPRRAELQRLVQAWHHTRRMAPMKFVLEIDLGRTATERMWCFAERHGALIGAAIASPLATDRGVVLEHMLRHREAPNGTSEALIDGLMQAYAADGMRHLSLGLAPLRGCVPPWLALAGLATRRLYNFRGLEAFKERLQPCAWVPSYIAHNAVASPVALYDACVAFSGGDARGFLTATLRRRWPGVAHGASAHAHITTRDKGALAA